MLVRQENMSLPALPSFDLDRVTHDLATSFNPLHSDCCLSYQVIDSRDGYHLVTLALPDGMSRAFVTFLESMTTVFRSISIKEKASLAHVRTVSPAAIAERDKLHGEFVQRVCSLFDGFISQGCSVNEAVKKANASLKAESHPWASYETVLSVLRKERRFRKK